MAPFSVNQQTLKESGYSSSVDIFHIPELFQKKWYKPQRQFVRYMVVLGLLGCLLGFGLLYVLSKLDMV